MQWVKLHGVPAYYLDGALLRAGEAAEVLFCRALAHCGAAETAGRVDKSVLPMLCNKPHTRASALVREGLWLDEGTHYQIRSWDRYQDAHDVAAAKRAGAKERKRRERDRRLADPVARDVTPPSRVTSQRQSRDVTPLEREGEREGEGEGEKYELPPSPAPQASTEPAGFADWYQTYPRHVAKPAAAKAYAKALRSTTADVLLAGARRFADDPTRDAAFTPHPATWLNAGRWDDEGPARPASTTPNASEQRTQHNLSLVARFAEREHQQPQLGVS